MLELCYLRKTIPPTMIRSHIRYVFGKRVVLAVYAAKYNSLNMVRFLVEMGCDKEMTDEWGATPLIAAAQRGYLKTVRFLVKSGASPHAADNFGKTALDRASLCGHARVVRYLSDKADSPRRKVRRLNNSNG